MYEMIAFYFFSIITLGMFSITVFSKNILYSMTSLAGGMIFISGFFFILDAEFIGVVQMIVYTGAVVALYAFGMMFFNTSRDVEENIACNKLIYTLSTISAILIVFIMIAPLYSQNVSVAMSIPEGVKNINSIGFGLFTRYLIPFELAAVMLLVAMIAGIVLVSKKMDKSISLDDDGFIVKESLK